MIMAETEVEKCIIAAHAAASVRCQILLHNQLNEG